MNDAVRVLVVDDEEIVRESLSGWLRKDGHDAVAAADGRAALDALRGERWDVVLVDLKMPGMDGLQLLEEARREGAAAVFVMMTAYATVDTAVSAMKLGAYDYLVKPFDPEELSALVRRIASQRALAQENESLRRALKLEYGFHDLVSKTGAMQRVFELARAAARSSSTILVLGESGSGKEVLARAIHAESPRAGAPFVAVSCAALTETLLESELFGHEKGAFTGAVARRKGKFELAQGGTLFLDEVGDVSPKLQLDLLRVLEERRFQRVGGTETLEADARVVAATNRDLQKAVAEGSFREDLFYRLNVIPITLPPLRERREDIPFLVQHFVERLAKELQRPLSGVSSEAMSALLSYGWPGNVRELRNVLERGAVVAHGNEIRLADLGLAIPEAGRAVPIGDPLSLEEVEKRHVAGVLRWAGGNVTQAARVLGIDRMTLYNKIKRYGLRRSSGEGQAVIVGQGPGDRPDLPPRS
jgi:two-component system, NtrC family, response regulator AtoC